MPSAGENIVMTSGDYSDYSMYGHFVVINDFSLSEQHERYLEELPQVPILEYGGYVPIPENERKSPRESTRYVRHDVPIDTGKTRKEYPSLDGFQAFLLQKNLIREIEVTEVHYDSIGTKYSNVD